MRAHEFLTEGKEEKIWKDWGDRIIARIDTDHSFPVPTADYPEEERLKDSKEYYNNLLASADPSKNQDYYVWITRLYLQKNFQSEDITRQVKDALIKYHRMKLSNQLPDPKYKDINFFKSLQDLVQVLPENNNPVVTNKGKYKVLADDNTCFVAQLLDVHAAIYFGQGTNPTWCTSYPLDDPLDRNAWDAYKDDGPIYVIIPKVNKNHPNEKYQWQFASDQFADRTNRNVDYEGMLSLVERCPIIKTLFRDELLQKLKYIDTLTCLIPLFYDDDEALINLAINMVSDRDTFSLLHFPKHIFTHNVIVTLLKKDIYGGDQVARQLIKLGVKLTPDIFEEAIIDNLNLIWFLLKHPEYITYKLVLYYIEEAKVSYYDNLAKAFTKVLSDKECYWLFKKIIEMEPGEVLWVDKYIPNINKYRNRIWDIAIKEHPRIIKDIPYETDIREDKELLTDIVERAVRYHCDKLSGKEESKLTIADLPIFKDTSHQEVIINENDAIDLFVRMIVWDSGTINDVPEHLRDTVQKEVDEELEKL